MLRAGLTGSLGSGKTTVAQIFREQGLHVLEADSIARELMQPGREVFAGIVEHFGRSVLRPDGMLDRPRLARLAFSEGHLNELNQIVHPPVVAEQERRMNGIFTGDPSAIVVVESALVFEAEAWGTVPGWRDRFDSIILVTAPDDLKMQRFLGRILPAHATLEERSAAERDARQRLAAQMPDSGKIPLADFVIDNAGSLDALRARAESVAVELRRNSEPPPGFERMPIQ
jgi:dephospho-CoA kinase